MIRQGITGIESVDYDRTSNINWRRCEQERSYISERCAGLLSNQIEAPITTESESINIVWIME